MIRFVIRLVWKLFVLFFFLNILTSWSRLQVAFTECAQNDACDYSVIAARVGKIVLTATTASIASIIELGNVSIFAAKAATNWLKVKTNYGYVSREML